MDPELKQKWVAALRSGEYKQGREALKKIKEEEDTCYCCLGVLCDILAKEGIGNWKADIFHHDAYASSGELPFSLYEKTEINMDDENTLINLNDDKGFSFPEIADWIAANL
jgi:hypothetical protein